MCIIVTWWCLALFTLVCVIVMSFVSLIACYFVSKNRENRCFDLVPCFNLHMSVFSFVTFFTGSVISSRMKVSALSFSRHTQHIITVLYSWKLPKNLFTLYFWLIFHRISFGTVDNNVNFGLSSLIHVKNVYKIFSRIQLLILIMKWNFFLDTFT